MRKWALLAALVPVLGVAQLRVATWNISNYAGGRVSDIQTAVFDTFEGRTMRPDVLVAQEIMSAAAQTALLNALNTAPGSSGTWASAPFTDGNDTDNAFFYRTDRLSLVASTIIGTGGNSPLPPRDTKRYDVRLLGYSVLQPKLAIYSGHFKAGTAPDDESRRLAEAFRIRNNAQALTGFDGFMVVGDFNTYSSSDDSFVKLTGSESNNTGRFFDPIATSGNWDGLSSFRFVHTQDPSGAGGMDSRFDFLLLCQSLVDGQGFEYVGNPSLAYSTLTWNDAAHSYRAWGNDGSSFNNVLTVTGNAMVGATIAQAIRNAATTSGGHIPVFLDLRVPAETAASPSALDFGISVVGSSSNRNVTVSNSTDTGAWGSGIANLLYTLAAPGPFTAPSGTFSATAGTSGNVHAISMNTSTPGEFSQNLTVSPTVAGGNTRTVSLTGRVVPDELFASSWNLIRGTHFSGGLAELTSNNNQYVTFSAPLSSRTGSPEIEFASTSPITQVNTIDFRFESNGSAQLIQHLDAYDYTAGAWVTISSQLIGRADRAVTVSLSSPNRFIAPGTRALRIRTRILAVGFTGVGQCTYKVDRVAWVLR